MPIAETDWTEVWKALGYTSEREMLIDLYLENFMSLSEISKVLGYSNIAIRRRLLSHRIPLRPRGGVNNLGKRKLKDIPDWVLKEPTERVAKALNVHASTIYAERRLRELSNYRSQAFDGAGDFQAETDSHGVGSDSIEGRLLSELVQAEEEGREEGNS